MSAPQHTQAVGKYELAICVAKRLGVRPRDTLRLVEVVIEELAAAIGKGRRIDIRGFGHFDVVVRDARPSARNPLRPSELHPVPRHAAVRFKAGKRLALTVKRLLPNGSPQAH